MKQVPQQQKGEAVNSQLTIKAFQDSVHDGKIEGYVCGNCGHKFIDIIDFCPVCHSADLKMMEFAKDGKVLTYTIQFVAPEQFMNEVPYAWSVIQLDDGPRVTGWIPFISKASDLLVGQKVRFKKSYLPGIVFEKI